ncbi:MAG TPA: polyprenyl diphosphate synthase [Candidatus Dormibacteraeota bacterium]|jgi:undecaprenyl diphosphate synthase|nr:polyprenyl diphosphate synthase [Candidatus Dormibacteraeota bacterium]
MDLPRHIAIIMDGNGRWARRQRRPRLEGHRAGLRAIRRVMTACDQIGVPVLSLYAFSTENWTRPRAEVTGLMRLFSETLDREIAELHQNGVQVRITGRRDGLSPALLRKVESAEALTRDNQRRVLNLLINYGGRAEVVDAVRRLVAGGVPAEEIDEAAISGALYQPDLPEPEIVIRTAGERRISNFLIWESAYSEFVFSDTLWPDFDLPDLEAALAEYAARERKFGGLRHDASA